MTPAIEQLIKANINYTLHQYEHELNCASYGLEAAEKLQVTPDRVFKTLVIQLSNQQLAVAIIPVNKKLNMKMAAQALNTKKVKMADATLVERSTAYVLGGVSPLGQKKKLKTLIDSSAMNVATLFVSAGKRGLELELTSHDLKLMSDGIFVPLS